TTQALLLPVRRQKGRERPPVVVAHRKERGFTDAPRVPAPSGEVEGAQGLVDVRVPPAVGPGRRAPEHRTVGSHLSEEPGWPNVSETAYGEKSARVFFVLLHVHHRRDAQLAQIGRASCRERVTKSHDDINFNTVSTHVIHIPITTM